MIARCLVIALIYASMMVAGHAQIVGGFQGITPPLGSAGGGGGGGGNCSNQLDFSQACNSQYIPVL